MSKKTTKKSIQRREEIINTCLNLYEKKTFSEITLKDIGDAISVSRPTIYNYFQSKEDIFLSVLEKEYEGWTQDLDSLLHQDDVPSRRTLARQIANTLKKRELFLRILSSDVPGMEQVSRQEVLSPYKAAKDAAQDMLQKILKRYCSELNAKTLPLRARSIMIATQGAYANAPTDTFEALFDAFEKLLSV